MEIRNETDVPGLANMVINAIFGDTSSWSMGLRPRKSTNDSPGIIWRKRVAAVCIRCCLAASLGHFSRVPKGPPVIPFPIFFHWALLVLFFSTCLSKRRTWKSDDFSRHFCALTQKSRQNCRIPMTSVPRGTNILREAQGSVPPCSAPVPSRPRVRGTIQTDSNPRKLSAPGHAASHQSLLDQESVAQTYSAKAQQPREGNLDAARRALRVARPSISSTSFPGPFVNEVEYFPSNDGEIFHVPKQRATQDVSN